jgi:hypothetical protein
VRIGFERTKQTEKGRKIFEGQKSLSQKNLLAKKKHKKSALLFNPYLKQVRHEAHNAVGARLGVELGERAWRALLGNLQVEEGVEQRGVELERRRLVLKGARERERQVNSRISAGKKGEEREK